MVKNKKQLFKVYGLDLLKEKGDSIFVPFRLMSGESSFRQYCSLYAKENKFSSSVNKCEGKFKVTRLN